MARIFLSYAREDVANARTLAGALERAGHQVWWDSHVGGGARFAAEIAAALKDAEAVIVLWSVQSIGSTWVQDEAAEGRDSGRLIPVLLDDTRPPLGFRQFQVVDLSRWSGRGRVPKLAAIEDAIATVLNGGTLAKPSEKPVSRQRILSGWPARAAAAIVALLLVGAAVLYGTGRFASKAEAASVAVLPFTDLSPTRDKAYFAEGISEDIRTLLSTVPGAKVVGRTSIAMLGPDAGLKEAREQLGVTHMLEGSMRIQGDHLRLNVRLLRTNDGMQIWSEQFDRDLTDIFKVQNEVGSAVAAKLRGRLWRFPLSDRSARTSVQVYDLVLAAGAKMGEETYEAALESNRLLTQAVRIDPNYSPAWTDLSRSIHAIDLSKPEGLWGRRWPAQRERALRYARRAVALDPKNADAQAFLGWAEADSEQPELALPRIEKAIALSPGESSVWGIASIIYRLMCDREREVAALRHYVALEPLSPVREDLMPMLYALGHTAEADELRRKLAQTSLADSAEIELAFRRGDVSDALARRLKKAPKGQGLKVAWMLSGLGRIGPAIEWLPAGYRDSLGAYWQQDYLRTAAQIDFTRTAPWDNARTIAIERSLVYTGRHRELLTIFDGRFRSVDDFDRRLRCHLPSHAAPLVVALRRDGRTAEAEQLIQMAERRYRQSPDASDDADHAGYIQLLVITGRGDEALGALEQTQRRSRARTNGPQFTWLNLDDPIYDPIRNQPRFKAVERKIAAWRAKEMRELAAAGVRV